MKSAKCPNCGANINVDESKDAGICEYCNTPFVTEKAISHINNTSNNAQTIINNYYTTPTSGQPDNKIQYIGPRPKINIFIALILCCFYLFPGIIYIIVKKLQQKEWDEKFNNS